MKFILLFLLLTACAFGQANGFRTSNTGWIGVTRSGGGTPTGNAFTLVQTQTGSTNSGASISLSFGSPITAGNLVTATVKCESAFTISSGASGTTGGAGGDAMVLPSVQDYASGLGHIVILYRLAATTSTSQVTITFSGAATFVNVVVREWSATGTHSLSASNLGSGVGAGSIATGAMTAGAVNSLALGAYGEFTSNTTSAYQIGANAATATTNINDTRAWYYLAGSQLSSVTANCTLGAGGSPAWGMYGAIFISL